uniref:Eukaryotic translation initiation factor 3 subunit G n=1 Tax=Tabanus bromius TaxID=304241 RepID=A0A0K8TPS6_TABBR
MPAIDDIKSSWADEVELDLGFLPPPTEVTNDSFKYVTEYKENDDGIIVKVIRTYEIAKQMVSKSVAKRKHLPKFGDSENDKPGPNSHTTRVSEDVSIQYISAKEEEKASEALPDPSKGMAKCRICSGEHWSVYCPYKGTAMDTGKLLENKPAPTTTAEAAKTGKYIPPFMKDGQKGAGGLRARDDTAAIRISNLSENMNEADLEELVKNFGPHSKMFLARDKSTGKCKGFAYVHFKNKRDAATAITFLNGYGYDHLILSVEWSKPQN